MLVLDPQALPMPPAVNIVRAHLLDRCADERSLILVDLLLVPDEFATDLLKRRVELEIGGQHRQVCSAEDLILLKLLAGRSKDLEDIRGIRRIQGDAIDVPYIEIWVDRLRCRENWRLVSS
jgi:predicted nucleotidyltransferase